MNCTVHDARAPRLAALIVLRAGSPGFFVCRACVDRALRGARAVEAKRAYDRERYLRRGPRTAPSGRRTLASTVAASLRELRQLNAGRAKTKGPEVCTAEPVVRLVDPLQAPTEAEPIARGTAKL